MTRYILMLCGLTLFTTSCAFDRRNKALTPSEISGYYERPGVWTEGWASEYIILRPNLSYEYGVITDWLSDPRNEKYPCRGHYHISENELVLDGPHVRRPRRSIVQHYGRFVLLAPGVGVADGLIQKKSNEAQVLRWKQNVANTKKLLADPHALPGIPGIPGLTPQ